MTRRRTSPPSLAYKYYLSLLYILAIANSNISMARLERKFMQEIKVSLLEANTWATILVDGNDYSPRPFDMVTCVDGQMIAIEGKLKKVPSLAFGMKDMRPSQIKNLDAVVQSGGHSFVFLNLFEPRKMNRLLIFEWNWFKEHTTKLGRSIYKKELLEFPYLAGAKSMYPGDEIISHIKKSMNN